MTLTGGQFILSAKPGCPGVWLVEWKSADGVVTGPVDARLDGPDGNPRDADAFWAECENADDEQLESLGEELWHFLISGEPGAAWSKAQKAAAALPAWRTGLQFDDSTLDAFPWEMMKDPMKPLHAGYSPKATFCRMNLAAESGTLADGWPWRVLVLKGCQDENEGIQSPAEVEAIYRAWWPRRHEVVITEVFPGGMQELSNLIGKFMPHVLHFVGHADAGGLQFERGGWVWSAESIALCYQETPLPRIVWLNACQTAATGIKRERTHLSLQQMFSRLGVPAVIGVRGKIDGGLAVQQAAEFYRRLSGGASVDAALALARTEAKKWRDDRNLQASITCHQPFLTALMLTSGGENPPQMPPPCSAYEGILQDTPPLGAVARWFVDRNKVRAGLFGDMLDHAGEVKKNPRSRLLVLHGEKDTGKTWVLYSLLSALASRGWLVRAHSMNGVKPLSWLEVLQLVRHGDSTRQGLHHASEVLKPLPATPFAEFDRIAASPAPQIEPAFDAFIKGLGACGGPVAIALDQIVSIDGEPVRPAWLELWETYFFKKLGRGCDVPVIALAVMDKGRLTGSPLNQEAWTHEVGRIEKTELEMALRHYFGLHLQQFAQNPKVAEKLNEFIRDWAGTADEGVVPCEFPIAYVEWAKPVRRSTKLEIPLPPV